MAGGIFEPVGDDGDRRNHGQQQDEDLDSLNHGLTGARSWRGTSRSPEDPAADRAQPKHVPGPSPGSVLLPKPAAREDDEQQREHAEAERQPAIHRQDTCARHLGGAGQVR